MRWTVLAASLCLASAAQAGTLLFLNSQAGDYIGQGAGRLITSANGTFTASRNFDNGVNVDFDGSTPGDFWSADLAAPMNAALVPGAYEGATRWPFQAAGAPGLSVYGDGRGCNVLSGRFVVLEATYDASGKVQSFAADFEQHCENAVPALFGSVRYQAGDPGCAGQPTGTATVVGLGGIVVDPAPPRFATTLVLRPDGTYRLPSTGITDCGPEIPDEVGTYRRGRRRRLILTPSNLDEIDAAGTICIGYP